MFEIDPHQVLAEVIAQVRTTQREVHNRLQESELVSGIVSDAVDPAAEDRPRFQQAPQTIGQLDFSRSIRLSRFEGREDVRREDVSSDYREIGRRFVAGRFLDEIIDSVDARAWRRRR